MTVGPRGCPLTAGGARDSISETGARFSGGSETRAPGIRTSFAEERRVDTGWTLAWVRDKAFADGPASHRRSLREFEQR